MKSRQEELYLPWSQEQMFDLVADVERYHEFLPAWTHARITRREGNVLTVAQGIDAGILCLDFVSRAELQRPQRLRVSSSGGPLRHLLLDWRFVADPRGGCMVALTVSIEMKSIVLEAAAARLLDLLTHDLIRRFRDRAGALYGN